MYITGKGYVCVKRDTVAAEVAAADSEAAGAEGVAEV